MNTFEQRRQLAYYRAAFHDMPVAGPMDGAAYGEYLKSKGIGMIIGVVASVVTMGAALPMLAGTLAMQIAGGVMMAGGVMSGVGAVTGNKKLMKIGGILSLAGGVGGIAAGAMGTAGGVGSESLANFAKEASSSIDSVLGTNLGTKAAANAAVSDQAGILSRAAAEGATPATDAMLSGEVYGPTQEVASAADEFAAGGQSIPGADGAAMSKAPDAGTLKLAEEAGAKTASEAAGKIDVAGAERSASAGGSGGGSASTPAAQTPPAKPGEKLFMGMDKTELLKTGAGLLEKGAAAAFAPDEEQKMEALTERYKAETVKLGTENDILAYKKANAGKQVAMIAANDPQMEQKVAAAAAAGHTVAFIPSIGAGGVSPTAGGMQMANPQAQKVAAQTPVRQPNFA